MRLTEAITKRLQGALLAEEFRVRRPGILTTTIDNAIEGWLGLNVTSRQKIVTTNVVVGVRSEALELLICDLAGKEVFGPCAPSIAIQIGYLMPERSYHPWFFESEPQRHEIEEIVTSVRQFGLPFMKSNSSLTRLAECLHDRTLAAHDQVMYRLPACYFLNGDRNTAITLCARYLDEVQGRRDAAAAQFRRFAAELLCRVKSE